MPVLASTAAARSGSNPIFTPSASRTSAAPLREEAERLPCLATLTPQAAITKDRRVEILSVPRPSPPGPHRLPTSAGAATGRIWLGVEVTAPTSSSTVIVRQAVAY